MKPFVRFGRTGSCKDEDIMFFLRHLFLFAANRNINILFQHVPGHRNKLADLLSRQQVQEYLQLQPHVCRTPSLLNPQIWRLSSLP